MPDIRFTLFDSDNFYQQGCACCCRISALPERMPAPVPAVLAAGAAGVG
ncbi:hypothetical protein M8494_30975 [Serratia ureilytica]